MHTSENNPNRKAVDEIAAVVQAAAAETVSHETEPAFSYFIETQTAQHSGDAE